jgi:hypothetical protein
MLTKASVSRARSATRAAPRPVGARPPPGCHRLDVRPGAERAPGAGEHDGAHARLLADGIEGTAQCGHQGGIKRVEFTGPVEHKAGDVPVPLNHQDLVFRLVLHARGTLPAGRSIDQ